MTDSANQNLVVCVITTLQNHRRLSGPARQ